MIYLNFEKDTLSLFPCKEGDVTCINNTPPLGVTLLVEVHFPYLPPLAGITHLGVGCL